LHYILLLLRFSVIFSSSTSSILFFLIIRRPPRSTLFPYTTSSDLCLLNPTGRCLGNCAGAAAVPLYFSYPSLSRVLPALPRCTEDRKSTRLNSSHRTISYAVFCLKKKKKTNKILPTQMVKKFITNT